MRRGVAAPAAAVNAVATGVVEAFVGGKDQLIDLNDGGDEGEDEEVEEEDVVKVICERIRAQMQKDWEEALELARREEGYSGIVRPTKA